MQICMDDVKKKKSSTQAQVYSTKPYLGSPNVDPNPGKIYLR